MYEFFLGRIVGVGAKIYRPDGQTLSQKQRFYHYMTSGLENFVNQVDWRECKNLFYRVGGA